VKVKVWENCPSTTININYYRAFFKDFSMSGGGGGQFLKRDLSVR
jgi:hypothetical protein